MVSELGEIAELHARSSTEGNSTIVGVNGHSGSDAWGEPESLEFFSTLHAGLDAAGLDGAAIPRLSHETHRGRILCCPFVTARLIAAIDRPLQLTSDFSHWVVKSERLLDTPAESALLRDVIAPRVSHIHARLGTRQTPQVSDPRSEETRDARERFFSFWQECWEAQRRAGTEEVTACVEYGPREWNGPGDYCGYTPFESTFMPGTDSHNSLLRTAAVDLRERFDQWEAGL
jgi:hypothetical protein